MSEAKASGISVDGTRFANVPLYFGFDSAGSLDDADDDVGEEDEDDAEAGVGVVVMFVFDDDDVGFTVCESVFDAPGPGICA